MHFFLKKNSLKKHKKNGSYKYGSYKYLTVIIYYILFLKYYERERERENESCERLINYVFMHKRCKFCLNTILFISLFKPIHI